MSTEDVSDKLEEAIRIIEQCRNALANLATVPIRSKPKALSEFILSLRDDGFLSEPRTAEEVHKQLEHAHKYHCMRKRVIVELIRLSNRRELRKTTKEVGARKLTAYTA